MDRFWVFLCCFAAACALTIAGCASIAQSIAENAVDEMTCRNECPDGPLREGCLTTCRNRFLDARKANEGREEDRQVWPEPGSAYKGPLLPAALDPAGQPLQRKQ
jgi:hypothetical protein